MHIWTPDQPISNKPEHVNIIRRTHQGSKSNRHLLSYLTCHVTCFLPDDYNWGRWLFWTLQLTILHAFGGLICAKKLLGNLGLLEQFSTERHVLHPCARTSPTLGHPHPRSTNGLRALAPSRPSLLKDQRMRARHPQVCICLGQNIQMGLMKLAPKDV